MIVQCDKCRTKFRIADAKVNENGVKVRCSRCAHVFMVTRGGSAGVAGGGPELDQSQGLMCIGPVTGVPAFPTATMAPSSSLPAAAPSYPVPSLIPEAAPPMQRAPFNIPNQA